MKVLVTGSGSFMGNCLVKAFVDYGYDVVGISRTDKNSIFKPYNNSDISFHECDINSDFYRATAIIDGFKPNVVVNCAALSLVANSWDNPYTYFLTNCSSAVRLAKHLLNKDYLDLFLQASTPEVYGSITDDLVECTAYNPSTPYGASKAAFDMYLDVLNRHYGFNAVMFRAANIYGAYQQLFRIVPKTIITIKNKGKLPLHGGGTSKRYFIHMSDVSDGVIKMIKHHPSTIYHLSSNDYLSIKELVEKICDMMNYKFEKLVEITEDWTGKDSEYKINCDKAKEELQWIPRITIEQGIKETINWVNTNWKVIKELDSGS
jgi:dTDP-glucose 4,6-dehydratase